MISIARFGWIPDLPDRRDFKYSLVRPGPVPPLPPATDLRQGCSAVENQGELGSCTAQSLAGALEFLERKARVKNFQDISRLFIYYNERVLEHSVGEDSGASLRDGIKTLVSDGACTEPTWPYDVAKFADTPPRACYKEAARHRIQAYARLSTLLDMKLCLASGFPFVFGFSVYSSFVSAEVKRSGILNLPGDDETLIGGHAVMAVGYDDASKRFIIRNSWGEAWGQSGYFTMPYDYLTDTNLADDFWTIRRQKGF